MISFEKTGAGGLVRFADLPPDLAEKAAAIVAEECRRECPVDTGALRSTVQVEPAPGGPTVAVGGPRAPYARWVIWGTSKRPPNHFVNRGLIRASAKIREAIKGG
jgi:HK97 gp10 family phage protein